MPSDPEATNGKRFPLLMGLKAGAIVNFLLPTLISLIFRTNHHEFHSQSSLYRTHFKHQDPPSITINSIQHNPQKTRSIRVRIHSHNATRRSCALPHSHQPPPTSLNISHSSNPSISRNPQSNLPRTNSTTIPTTRPKPLLRTPLASPLHLRRPHARLRHSPPTTTSTLPLLFQHSLGAECPRRRSQNMC